MEPFQWYLREDFQYLSISHGRRDRISLTHIEEDFRFLSENVYVCPHETTVSDYAEVNANGI